MIDPVKDKNCGFQKQVFLEVSEKIAPALLHIMIKSENLGDLMSYVSSLSTVALTTTLDYYFKQHPKRMGLKDQIVQEICKTIKDASLRTLKIDK